MQQQKVILITGMPGAGKTTLVKELQKKYANAVAIQCPGKPTLYVDPSGSGYCRYMGIEL